MPINQWNASLYDQKHSFVFEYGKELVKLLDPKPGERILDLGSGTGHLTKEIFQTVGDLEVVGIDSSSEMIEVARKNYPEIEFIQADIREFSLPYSFDAVFSNAVLHWISEAEMAAANISKALKSGGRFVAEFGGKGNVSNIVGTLKTVIKEMTGRDVEYNSYFPSIGEYSSLLERHSLRTTFATLYDRPTKLNDGELGLRNWIEMFRGGMFDKVDSSAKGKILYEVEESLRSKLFKDGHWYADYRRLRVMAIKE